MAAFAYHRPITLAEALAALATRGARALAGGTDLIVQMREGRRAVENAVDLKHVAELVAIVALADGGLRIGAAASATAVAAHATVQKRYPAIADAARMIGSWQIQTRASLGGNLCNGAPSADAAPPLLAAGATVEIAGPGGTRSLDVERLFAGPGRTTLQPGELVVAILLPPVEAGTGTAYLRFTPRREMDIAIAGVGASIVCDASGRIGEARVALASVAPTPIRALGAETLLAGEAATQETFARAAKAAAAECQPISDTRGSADYRRALVETLTARALAACVERIERARQRP